MKKMYLASLCLIFLYIFGCKKADTTAVDETAPPFDMVAAKIAIETECDVFAAALNKGDSIGLANCYTKDAKFMQPNAKAVAGREDIQKLFGQWIKAGALPIFSAKTIEVWGDENVMTVEAEYTFTNKDGKVVDQGKALELFKMEDGKWRLHRDCYNSDMPAAK